MVKKADKKEEKPEVIEDDIILEVDDVAIENLGEKKSGFGNPTKKKENRLKKCVAEKQEYLDGWQRSKADLINAKKDFEEQRKDFVKFAKGDLIMQTIPVLDSFEMAFKNTDGVPEQWLKGVEHIHNQFNQILEDNGVKSIGSVGEKFDTNLHTAVEMVKVDDEEQESIILEVVQKGYSLNDKIIREAKVRVGEFEK